MQRRGSCIDCVRLYHNSNEQKIVRKTGLTGLLVLVVNGDGSPLLN